MKIHNYERAFVLKKYAHNIPQYSQGFQTLTIIPKLLLHVSKY